MDKGRFMFFVNLPNQLYRVAAPPEGICLPELLPIFRYRETITKRKKKGKKMNPDSTEKRIVLASQSPRRIQLLRIIGIDAEVMPSGIPEQIRSEKPEAVVSALSEEKARDVAARCPGRLVIAADTVVSIDGQILGKPKSPEEACAMLRRLSGRTHQVYTGVTLLSGEKEECFVEKTEVTFQVLTDEEIRTYVRSGDPMDKAGAYGIQGSFAKHVRGISGDYYNVVGLPLARLYDALKRF